MEGCNGYSESPAPFSLQLKKRSDVDVGWKDVFAYLGSPTPFSLLLCNFGIFIRTHAYESAAQAKQIIKRKRKKKEEHRKERSHGPRSHRVNYRRHWAERLG